MTVNKNNHLNKIISIPVNKIDVNKIVNQVKTDIKRKRLDYIKSLESIAPDIIDTWENGEFLLAGWHEPENIYNVRARWTKKQFSFLFNIKTSNQIALELVPLPEQLKPKSVKAQLEVNNKVIASNLISKNKNVVFFVPSEYQNKLVTYQIKLRSLGFDYKKPQSDHKGLGLPIKTISNHETSIAGKTYLPAIQNEETNLQFIGEKINYHKNPIKLLPRKTRLIFVKELILRIIRPFTAAQVAFNGLTSEYINHLNRAYHHITGYLKTLDIQIKEISSLVKDESKSTLFYHQHQGKFHKFQQDRFRGSYQTIKKAQKKYLKYLKNIKGLNKKYVFLEIGFGRGEFLELLKEAGFKNVIGIDTNKEYIKTAENRGYSVEQADIMDFIVDYQDKISGASLFHILEHLDFEKIFDLLYFLYQRLTKDGVLIIETPNTENLQVGANNFFYDATHKTKLPPLFLETVFKYIGYKNIKIIRSSPIKKNVSSKNQIEKLIFGNQDYAIVAYK